MSIRQMFDFKRCPRCNLKAPNAVALCPRCSLNYQKFESATNEEAKIAYSEDEKDRVLLRKGFPSDVRKYKLVLMVIFLGLFGGHYYYVGRRGMGAFYSLFFIVGATYTYLNQYIPYSLFKEIWFLLAMVWVVILFMWMSDIFKICINKFKIPVSLQY